MNQSYFDTVGGAVAIVAAWPVLNPPLPVGEPLREGLLLGLFVPVVVVVGVC